MIWSEYQTAAVENSPHFRRKQTRPPAMSSTSLSVAGRRLVPTGNYRCCMKRKMTAKMVMKTAKMAMKEDAPCCVLLSREAKKCEEYI
jgi:hypothetical protein